MQFFLNLLAVFFSLTLFVSGIFLLIATVGYLQGAEVNDVIWALTWFGPAFLVSVVAGVFWRRDIFHLVWSWAIPLP